MKRIEFLLFSILLSLFLSGCSAVSHPASDVALSSSNSSFSESESDIPPLTDDRINELIEKNLYCMFEIFSLGSLPTQGEPLHDMVYLVDETKFASYSAFESYLRDIYVKDEADLLLYNYPMEGRPKYLNEAGKLCVDMELDGGRGYYVDWENYTFERHLNSANRCDLVLHALIEEPADEPVAEEYEVTVTVLYQNGKWMLTELFY